MIVTLLLAPMFALALDPPKMEPQPAEPAKTVGIAVVELFTSEGCSSCPPADEFLARIEREQKDGERHVFPLAFHVDYWDSLGWKDPFASKAYSDRQHTYAARFAKVGGRGGVYTPQIVVNGSVELIGSDEASGRNAIQSALARAPMFEVVPSIAERKVGEPIRITATTKRNEHPAEKDVPDHANVLSAALVENGLTTDVKRGENGGRTLGHERVVRAFAQTRIEAGKGVVELEPPEGVKEDRCRVVVYVQDAETHWVRGAAEIALSKPKEPESQPTTPPKPTQSPNPAQKK